MLSVYSSEIKGSHPCQPITKKPDHKWPHKWANLYKNSNWTNSMKSWQNARRQRIIMIQLFIWLLSGVKSELWSPHDMWMISSWISLSNIIYTLHSVLGLLPSGRRLSVFISSLLFWLVLYFLSREIWRLSPKRIWLENMLKLMVILNSCKNREQKLS